MTDAEVYAIYQEHTKKSELLRHEIAGNLNDGTDPNKELLKAIECISLMCDDKAFYEHGKNMLEPKITSD